MRLAGNLYDGRGYGNAACAVACWLVWLASFASSAHCQTPLVSAPGPPLAPFGSDSIPIRLKTLFTIDDIRGPQVLAIVSIDANALKFNLDFGGSHSAKIEGFVSVFDNRGELVHQATHAGNIVLAEPAWQLALKNGVQANFPDSLTSKPGAYRIEVTVRDIGTDRIGSASGSVEEPDLKSGKLTLTSVFIDEKDAHPGAEPLARVFHPGDTVTYNYGVINARVDAQGESQLLSQVSIVHNGKPAFQGATAPLRVKRRPGSKELIVAGQFKLGRSLEPGAYELQVTVTDASGKDSAHASEQTGFRVQ